MKTKRREFLKMAGLAGLSLPVAKTLYARSMMEDKTHSQRFNMSGYAAPPIDNVRVGIIGLGNRGPTYIKTMGPFQGVEIKALAEL